jgi:hypothetical protein
VKFAVHTIPCLGCGQSATFTMTEDQFNRYTAGEHVQRIFPDWPPEDREMLISGTCPPCWEEMWPDDDEEDDDDEFGWSLTDKGAEALESVLSGAEGYLNGDESADWRDSDKDWYPED